MVSHIIVKIKILYFNDDDWKNVCAICDESYIVHIAINKLLCFLHSASTQIFYGMYSAHGLFRLSVIGSHIMYRNIKCFTLYINIA